MGPSLNHSYSSLISFRVLGTQCHPFPIFFSISWFRKNKLGTPLCHSEDTGELLCLPDPHFASDKGDDTNDCTGGANTMTLRRTPPPNRLCPQGAVSSKVCHLPCDLLQTDNHGATEAP